MIKVFLICLLTLVVSCASKSKSDFGNLTEVADIEKTDPNLETTVILGIKFPKLYFPGEGDPGVYSYYKNKNQEFIRVTGYDDIFKWGVSNQVTLMKRKVPYEPDAADMESDYEYFEFKTVILSETIPDNFCFTHDIPNLFRDTSYVDERKKLYIQWLDIFKGIDLEIRPKDRHALRKNIGVMNTSYKACFYSRPKKRIVIREVKFTLR